MDTTVIKNLKRDDKGNFSYRATDGSIINVTAGSTAAPPLQSFWTVCQELHATELAKVTPGKKPNLLLDPFRWIGRLVENFFSRFARGNQSRELPPAAVEDWGVNPAETASASSRKASLDARPAPETHAPVRREPVQSGPGAPAEERAVPAQKTPAAHANFEVEEIRRLPGDAGFFVRFAEGIEVNVPPQSPYAARFEQAFQQLQVVKQTLDEVDPARVIANGHNPTAEPNLVAGKIVMMPQSVGGKERFAFEHEGRSHPIKLTQRESVILRTLLQSGKLKGVAATVEPATLVTIRGLELEDRGRKQTVNFRNFVQQVIKDPTLAQPSPDTETPLVAPATEGPPPIAATEPPRLAPAVTLLAERASADAAPPHPADAASPEHEENVRFDELPPSSAAPGAYNNFADLRILVAEDNPTNRDIMAAHLAALGCKPEFAANGTEAIQAVEAKAYDLVFMDLQMPEIDGFEATRTIRDRVGSDRAPQIIALTADTSEGVLNGIAAVGITSHLSKPVKKEDVLHALQSFVSTRVKPVSTTNSVPEPFPERVPIPDAEVDAPAV